MVEAPARRYEPPGFGVPSGPTGLTRWRSRSRGTMVMGLLVSVRLPTFEGSGRPVPVELGVEPGPCTSTTWLLTMSTGMSRIDVTLLRRHLGQRADTSNIFSPSI